MSCEFNLSISELSRRAAVRMRRRDDNRYRKLESEIEKMRKDDALVKRVVRQIARNARRGYTQIEIAADDGSCEYRGYAPDVVIRHEIMYDEGYFGQIADIISGRLSAYVLGYYEVLRHYDIPGAHLRHPRIIIEWGRE